MCSQGEKKILFNNHNFDLSEKLDMPNVDLQREFGYSTHVKIYKFGIAFKGEKGE